MEESIIIINRYSLSASYILRSKQLYDIDNLVGLGFTAYQPLLVI